MKRIVVALLCVLFLIGCDKKSDNNDTGNTPPAPTPDEVKITVSIPSQGGQQSIAGDRTLSASRATKGLFRGTVEDIKKITIEVLEGGQQVVAETEMVKSGNQWTVTLTGLKKGASLVFIAHAYNESNLEIFAGTTTQALTGRNQSVAISLAPIPEGSCTEPRLPQIKRILLPKVVAFKDTIEIAVSVANRCGENLAYKVTGVGVASFAQASGSIPMQSNQGTITLSYTAPSEEGKQDFIMEVTNKDGFTIKSAFSVNVIPYYVVDSGISVYFSPIITNISGMRLGDNVLWTVVAQDDTSSDLTYLWQFDGSLAFADETANPATMENYDPTISGTITVTVADDNGETTLSFLMPEQQFPNNVVDETDDTNPNPGFPSDTTTDTNPDTTNPDTNPDTTSDTNPDTTNPDTTPVVEKATLKLSKVSAGTYKVTLLTPATLQDKALSGVSNLGMQCPGFNNLSGFGAYQPKKAGIGNYVSIGFTDTSGSLTTAGDALDLYSFGCSSAPTFDLKSQASIVYANEPAIGTDDIGLIGL